ncbi:MAG: hypothetical protein V7739_02530 [Motiliproteus sp.]
MSELIQSLLEKSHLDHVSQSLSISQLESALEVIRQLIEEKREFAQGRELHRKGERVLGDMRGLMAKAGVSMADFQNALNDL